MLFIAGLKTVSYNGIYLNKAFTAGKAIMEYVWRRQETNVRQSSYVETLTDVKAFRETEMRICNTHTCDYLGVLEFNEISYPIAVCIFLE